MFQTEQKNIFNIYGSRVWVLLGETGQGKSTLTNALCKYQAAVIGPGSNSETSQVTLYESELEQLFVLDTPGYYDTRGWDNNSVSKNILHNVKDYFHEKANIEALLLIWSPNNSLRSRLLDIVKEISTTFGDGALDSVIIIVNKITNEWSSKHKLAAKEMEAQLAKQKLNIPVLYLDALQLNSLDETRLQNAVAQILPYEKEYFDQYRRQHYEKKFTEIRNQYNKQKEAEHKLKQEYAEKIEIERKAKEQAEKELKAEQQKYAEKIEMERKAKEQAEKELKAEQQKYAALAQNISQSQQSYCSSSVYFPFNYSPSNYSPSNYSPSPSASQSSETKDKFYPGGQYLPGPREKGVPPPRAPAGGITIKVPISGNSKGKSGKR